jgi:hypothetical protein
VGDEIFETLHEQEMDLCRYIVQSKYRYDEAIFSGIKSNTGTRESVLEDAAKKVREIFEE